MNRSGFDGVTTIACRAPVHSATATVRLRLEASSGNHVRALPSPHDGHRAGASWPRSRRSTLAMASRGMQRADPKGIQYPRSVIAAVLSVMRGSS